VMSETERSAHLRRWAEGIRRARSSG
jgi:hypothetical protein